MTRRRLRPPREAARAAVHLVSGEAAAFIQRQANRALARGPYAAPLDFERDRTVLLFYEDFERDRFFRHDRHFQRALRRVYHAVTHGQPATGVEVAFRLLVTALERASCRVVVNDFTLARRNPDYPVGITGYPHILAGWPLPNPALLGPGLLDHPAMAPGLMEDPRFFAYLVPSEWTRAMYERLYEGRCALWFAGIDLDAWPDLRAHPKDIDFLVYDKVTVRAADYEDRLVKPLITALEARGQRHRVIRYGAYEPGEYRALLARSRAMAFLSESETQGIAYQQAMACNVPILAWDNGFWLDPRRETWQRDPVPASSVPHFADASGLTFREASEIPAALDAFLAKRDRFEPRRFVEETLSLEASAARYLALYRAAAASRRAIPSPA
ncbi:MAG: glycosyltransferase [Minicystis sp.]